MTSPLSALIVAALRDPDVVAAVRDALGSAPPDPWLTLAEAAKHAGIGEEHAHVIRDACRRKELPSEKAELPSGKVGRATVVRRSAVDAWIVGNSAKTTKTKPPTKAKPQNDVDDPRAEARAAVEQAGARAARVR